MTVEMDKPFVWPEVTDLEKWDKSVYEATKKERESYEKQLQPDASRLVPTDRSSIAEQAKALLKGDGHWKTGNLNDKWVDGAEEVEVETDVEIPQNER
jgi:large subunit ribosomal protein L23